MHHQIIIQAVFVLSSAMIAMAGLARADVITTGDLDPGVTGMQDDPWTVGY